MQYLTREQVEQTRMPEEWAPPQQLANPFAGSMMGGGMRGVGMQGQSAGYNPDPRGMVDPAALVNSAQGGDYDFEGRRNAIAARVLANQAAQTAYSSGKGGAGGSGGGSNEWRDYWVQNYGADPNSPFFQGTEDWKGSFF